RFMFNIWVDYPDEEEEYRIVEMTTSMHVPRIDRMLSATDILEMQDIVRKVPVAPYVIRYAMKFTRLTRKGSRVAHAPGATAGAIRVRRANSRDVEGPAKPQGCVRCFRRMKVSRG